MRWIGLDTHHRFIQGTIISDTADVSHFRVATDAAGLTVLKAYCGPDSRVVMEASTSSFRLRDELLPHAGEVIVAHATQTRGASAWHVKTDQRDSETLARLLMTDFIRPVWVPSQACRGLRGLMEYRMQLSRQRVAYWNRAAAKFREELMEYPEDFAKGRRARIDSLEAVDWHDRHQTLAIRSVARMLRTLDKEIAGIDTALAKWTKTAPEATLLQTIPGIGPVLSAIMVTEIGNVQRFPTAPKLCAYAGLVPRVYASGKTVRTSHLSHNGRGLLRWAAYFATTALVRYDGRFRQVYLNLCSRRPKQVALTACSRKLLTVVWHMLRRQEEFRRHPLPARIGSGS